MSLNPNNLKNEVEQAVALFRDVMVNPDQQILEKLTSPILSYGHSNGMIEDRETCITSLVSGKYKFPSIELSDQTIDIAGFTAVVRHTLFAHTHDEGKEPGTVKLKVLNIWHKEAEEWRLIARQAVKI